MYNKFTKTGLAMSAPAQNPTNGQALGVNAERKISPALVIGSGPAILGGLPSGCHMRRIDFHIGFLAEMKAFWA
jgi:branched-subunit amino acid ABC-type transport system permease component